jgi:uncharacterized membrane protein YfcA
MPDSVAAILAQWPTWTWIAALVAVVFAAVTHGAIGFGFPLLSTPLVALFTDVRTAVLTTLLPNIVLNVISVVRGPDWLATLRRFWPVAAYVLVGTLIGSRVLVYADTRLLKLMLAAMIVVHLMQGRWNARWLDLSASPRFAQAFFGLIGGFFSGTVNVAVPALLMYFSTLSLAPVVMTQALNLSFLVGRSTQAVALVAAGRLGAGQMILSVPLTLICVLSLSAGFGLQRRIRPQTFALLMRIVLWAMAATLVGQVAWGALRAYLS